MTDKRNKLNTIIEKLKKLIAHFDNANANEAHNAFLRATELLRSHGVDWRDFCNLSSDNKAEILDVFVRLLEKDADVLIRLGRAGATYFRSAEGAAYADVAINGHRETYPLGSAEFSDFLVHRFYAAKRKSPTSAALKSAIRTLSAHARFEGGHHEVHLRIAQYADKIYFDLADPEWRAVEIDPSGWRVVHEPPVRFRRSAGMAALPVPQPGGSITQLRSFVNLSDAYFVLFVAVLLDALLPGHPHPVLYLAGEEGSIKSTTAEIARSLIDPSTASLRTLPRSVRDLFVDAHGAHMLTYDNLSSISPAVSDALCQITSGSGFGTRKLYTDTGQLLIGGSRPVVLTGLANVITRSDLADRAVIIPQCPVTDEQRRCAAQLRKDFKREQPLIFGALLDAVVCGLKNLPNVRLERLPRLADFATWAVACEEGYAKSGALPAAFAANATEAIEAVIEDNSVATAVRGFMADRGSWGGTAAGLLAELTDRDQSEARPSKCKDWPRDPAIFSKRLRGVAAPLRKSGIQVEFGKTTDSKRTRLVELRRIEPQQPARRADTADGSDRSDGFARSIENVIPFRES